MTFACTAACFEDPQPAEDDTSSVASTDGETSPSTTSSTSLGLATSTSSASGNAIGTSTASVTSDASSSDEAGSGPTTPETGDSTGNEGADEADATTGWAGDSTSTSEPGGTESSESGDPRCSACATGFCDLEGACARGIFVTSVQYAAGFGGLTGADLYCRTLARAAGHPGDWMAWLSDSNLDAGARIPGASDPYVLVNGVRVAANFDVFTTHIYGDLDAIYLEHAIDRDEYGEIPDRGTACSAYPAALPVWASTLTNGWWDSESTCDDWTSSAELTEDATVYLADARSIDSFWTVFACAETDCGRTASLYCLQISE